MVSQNQPSCKTTWIWTAVLAATLLLGGCVDYDDNNSGRIGVEKTAYTDNLVNGIISVPANNHHYYQFTMDENAERIKASGEFTASGGSGNDIIVLILDQQGYTNYANGHDVSTYYNSGKVTTDEFSATLPNGSETYYLVYDNSFSTFTTKDVSTRVDVDWVAY